MAPSGKANSLSSFPLLIQIDARKGNLYLNWHQLSGSKTMLKMNQNYYKLKTLKSMKGVDRYSLCLDFEKKEQMLGLMGLTLLKF